MAAGFVAHPERCRYQWRECLNIRTHDQDVARLQSRVVLEQAQDDLAHDFHLARRAVGGVHAQAGVGCFEGRLRFADPVVGEIVL